MFAFEPGEWRGRRAEDAALSTVISGVELFAKLETVRTHATQVWPMDQQGRECYEGWIRMILTVANLFVIEAFEVLRARMAESIVIRMISLNQHLPRPIAAAGPSRHLGN